MKPSSRALSVLAVFGLVLFLFVGAFAADGETQITILATSDLHGNIWGFSYEDSAETTNNGMARLYTYIQQVREENPNTFLFDGGDVIQGTIMTDDLYNKTPDQPHPVMAAMNAMGFDAMTLGNHEFNWGIDVMNQITSQAEFPVLGQNILTADGEFVTGNGWVLLERGGIKLALIGVTTPDVPIWDGGKQGIDEITYEAANEAVKKAVAEIGDQADLIMVTAHMGMNAEFDEDNGSDAGSKILEDNPEVDLLQVAHMHIQVNEMAGDVPVFGVRNGGREIARVDLTLDADKNIIDVKSELVDMADVTPSEEIRSIPLVKEAHEKTIAFIKGGGGADGEEGGAALGTTTAKFQPENEIVGLPAGKLMDTAVMDLINTIQLENSGADVSAAALFKDTSDLPEGDINYGNIFDIYKYDNTLYRVTVTGKELKAYMEWAAECYNQWQEGDINISFDPEYPGYLYDMFAGVDYEINLSKPKGERIENVMFKGEPLADDTTLTLAVNNYRYSSALKSQNLVEGKREWESSNSIRDMIVAYFADNSPVAPTLDNNWHISGVDLNEEDPRRAELIDYINRGLLAVPYDASYNLADYDTLVAEAHGKNFVLDGVAHSLSTADETFYSLKEVAQLLKGTKGAFDFAWDGESLTITTGTDFSGEAVEAEPTAVSGAESVSVAANVNGQELALDLVRLDGIDYISAEGINAILGIEAVQTDWVLSLSTSGLSVADVSDQSH